MKILFITRKYPPARGGMENLSFELTQRIECDKKIIALGKKNQIHIIWFIPYALIYALIYGRKYDIVHLGDLVLAGIGFFVKLAHPAVKVAINAHGLDITYRYKKTCPSFLYNAYQKLFAGKAAYDLLVCNSKSTEKLAQNSGYGKIAVINPGVNMESAGMSKHSAANKLFLNKETEGKYVLVTLGRLVKRKGVSWFLENVVPKLPENSFYIIAGGGNWNDNGNKEAREIDKIISEKKLSNKAAYIGEINDEKRDYLFALADLFIMPNIGVKNDLEGFGIAAIEASARGVAVIASDLEGLKDAVAEGVNGFLLPPGNAAAFAEKITEVLNNGAIMTQLSKDGKEYVNKYFSWDVIIKQYQKSFQRLLDEKI